MEHPGGGSTSQMRGIELYLSEEPELVIRRLSLFHKEPCWTIRVKPITELHIDEIAEPDKFLKDATEKLARHFSTPEALIQSLIEEHGACPLERYEVESEAREELGE
jgi:hypothetical protein